MHEINFKLGPMSKSCFFVPNAGTKKAVIYNVLKIPISMVIITQGKYMYMYIHVHVCTCIELLVHLKEEINFHPWKYSFTAWSCFVRLATLGPLAESWKKWFSLCRDRACIQQLFKIWCYPRKIRSRNDCSALPASNSDNNNNNIARSCFWFSVDWKHFTKTAFHTLWINPFDGCVWQRPSGRVTTGKARRGRGRSWFMISKHCQHIHYPHHIHFNPESHEINGSESKRWSMALTSDSGKGCARMCLTWPSPGLRGTWADLP